MSRLGKRLTMCSSQVFKRKPVSRTLGMLPIADVAAVALLPAQRKAEAPTNLCAPSHHVVSVICYES